MIKYKIPPPIPMDYFSTLKRLMNKHDGNYEHRFCKCGPTLDGGDLEIIENLIKTETEEEDEKI